MNQKLADRHKFSGAGLATTDPDIHCVLSLEVVKFRRGLNSRSDILQPCE